MYRNLSVQGIAALTLASSLALAANSTEESQSQSPSYLPPPMELAPVSPISGNNIPNMFSLNLNPQDQQILPMHPPIDEIPWMPMHEPVPVGIMNPQEIGNSSVTYRDSVNGVTREIPRSTPSGLIGAQSINGEYQGFDNPYDNYEETLESFGSMTQASALGTWPRSGNVKLVMRFTNDQGNFRWFVCSGSMQDAGVVLTAAHCVYNRDSTINDWADIIYVYPGWDGNGATGDTDVRMENFGVAYGTTYLAGTNYINNGDWDADIAVIRLSRGGSRNIGMLTGWYAWAWGGSCGSIQSRTYNNFSYPSENCPNAGLHNGRDMYYWSGSIDSCPGNQMQLDTGGGNCFDTVWGGMSGSGMYYFENDNRFVHAVCSTSNRTTRGRYAKLWEGFVNDMEDYKTTTRGSTFDIEALRFRARGSTSVYQGQQMDDRFDVAIVNATNANPAADQYTLRVYLSTNNNISSGDTLLATWNYNVNFGAMSNINFNMPGPIIPLNTPPGDYWIGVEIDTSEDSIPSNNDTDVWDAQPITVLEAHPDLDAELCNASSGTFYRGESINVNHRTRNIGERITGNVNVEFRASTNTTISTFDTLMEDRTYSPIAIGNSINSTSNVQIPPTLAPGNYYIGTITSESSGLENTTSNNTVSDTNTITVLECVPDLTGDGQANFFDVSAFLSAFNNMDPIADFNNDGNFNFFDVSAFLAAFNTGCP